MPVDVEVVRGMAQSIIESFHGMTDVQREAPPSTQIVERFNHVLARAKESTTSVDQLDWPPVARSDSCHSDIETFARDIIRLLPITKQPAVISTGIEDRRPRW
jgi:hypothetical protein